MAEVRLGKAHRAKGFSFSLHLPGAQQAHHRSCLHHVWRCGDADARDVGRMAALPILRRGIRQGGA